MQAGKLNNRVAIDRPDVSQNETGEEIISWHEMGKVWCSIEPLAGREALQVNANLAVMDTRFRFRWTPGLSQMTTKWRMRRPNLIYNIVSIAEILMDQKEIEVLAKSGANEG
jgi:SPP1 family predicted phage head-tail adaptor